MKHPQYIVFISVIQNLYIFHLQNHPRPQKIIPDKNLFKFKTNFVNEIPISNKTSLFTKLRICHKIKIN